MSKKTIYIAGLGLIGGSLALGIKGTTLIMRFLDIIALTIPEILHLSVASLTVQQVISKNLLPSRMLLSLQCRLSKLWPT